MNTETLGSYTVLERGTRQKTRRGPEKKLGERGRPIVGGDQMWTWMVVLGVYIPVNFSDSASKSGHLESKI